jgi:hypothetical protein
LVKERMEGWIKGCDALESRGHGQPREELAIVVDPMSEDRSARYPAGE